MKKPGRKSASEQAIKPVELVQKRPAPPASLTADMAATWIRVTACFSPDYFRGDSLPLLEAYVRHIDNAARLDAEIDAMKPEWLKMDDGLARYKTLLDLREKQTRVIASIARSLRITHQSRVHKDTAARKVESTPGAAKPWDW